MQNLLLLGFGGAAILGGWAFKRLLGAKFDKSQKDIDSANSAKQSQAAGDAKSAKSPKILKGVRLGKDDRLILKYDSNAKISRLKSLLNKAPEPFKQPEFKSERIGQLYRDKIAARKQLCEHLGIWVYERGESHGLQGYKRVKKPVAMEDEPCFELAKQELQLYAQLESEQSPLYQRALEVSAVMDGIYGLESECFRTHETLAGLARSICTLANFEPNEAITNMGCFHFHQTAPIYERIAEYAGRRLKASRHGVFEGLEGELDYDEYLVDFAPQFVINESKYALNAYDTDSLHQIKLAKRCLQRVQAWLNAQKSWLDALIASQKGFKPYVMRNDLCRDIRAYAPGMGSVSAVQRACAFGEPRWQRADFENFAQSEQEQISLLARWAEQICRVINGDFAENGKCKSVRAVVDECRKNERFVKQWQERDGRKKPKLEYTECKNLREMVKEMFEKYAKNAKQQGDNEKKDLRENLAAKVAGQDKDENK